MYQQILDFWFEENGPEQWFKSDPAFDQQIRQRFSTLHEQATLCECWQWRREPHGRLAEIILLDQFSRNMFRDTPAAFAQDPLSLALAQEAVATGADRSLQGPEKAFLYMPYMHSESALIHQQAVTLFDQPGLEQNYDFELQHKAIIDRFGRYPHRNAILGRTSTSEEAAFLQQPGSRF